MMAIRYLLVLLGSSVVFWETFHRWGFFLSNVLLLFFSSLVIINVVTVMVPRFRKVNSIPLFRQSMLLSAFGAGGGALVFGLWHLQTASIFAAVACCQAFCTDAEVERSASARVDNQDERLE